MLNRTLIIAEAGVNHNGSLKLAKKLIECAVTAEADFVKFQTFITENCITKNAEKAEYQHSSISDDETQFEMIKKLELDRASHEVLLEHCEKKGIRFLSTAFDHVRNTSFIRSNYW